MALSSILLILILSISEIDLFVSISDFISKLQSYCLKITPSSEYAEVYAALVCGNPLTTSDLSQNFKNLGIYHAIVVSGSHLIFLSTLLEKIFRSHQRLKPASFFLLFIYSLATGAEPPVFRAFVSIGLHSLQKKLKLFWNTNEVLFVSLLICFLFNSSWKNSYSLLLSYVASLSLTLSKNKNILKTNCYIYLTLLPFLLPLSAPHPLSIVTNMTLAPLIGFVLFPLSFTSYFIPYFYKLVDFAWEFFLKISYLLGPEIQTLETIPIPLYWLWTFAILLNFYGICKAKRVP